MEDKELEELREKKMDEMQGDSGEEGRENSRRQQIKQQAAQYLTKEARSRLGNIRAARPELASSIEMQIARMGKMGRIEEMTDDQLKNILREIQEDGDKNEKNLKFRK